MAIAAELAYHASIVAKSSTLRAPAALSASSFRKLQRDLQECSGKVESLQRELEITTRRMGTMQAEIDHLRAVTRSR
jgi:hypothetical protein